MLCEDYSSSAFVQVSESNGWICFVHWILDQKKTTNYLYTHNNDPLEPNERITFANGTVTLSSQLTITLVMPGDRGTYWCLVVNPRGSANKEIVHQSL